MAVLGLRFCARAFSTCGKWGPLFIIIYSLRVRRRGHVSSIRAFSTLPANV